MSRKIPVGYEVCRPLTLWGQRREIGEYLPREEVASMVRIESMVRAGRFVEVFEKPEIKTTRTRGVSTRKVKKAKDKPVVAPVVEAPVVVEAPALPVPEVDFDES